MKSYKEFTSIHLCVSPVDFRKGLHSLASFVEQAFDEKPFSGSLFLFTNKNKRNIKALYWDKTGFALWQKALEEERFPWPKKSTQEVKFVLTVEQFSWLLDGIDPWKITPHARLDYSRIT